MKKLFFIPLLMLCIFTNAQTKSIELYELIKLFAPDAAAPAGNWQIAEKNVKWTNAQPVSKNKIFVRNATVNLSIGNKPTLCMNSLEGMEEACDWSLSLRGNKGNYSSWRIAANDYHIEDQKQATQLLFPKADTQLKVLKKFDEGVTEWFYIYEVTIPGKKVFYMKVEYATGTATAAQAQNNGHDSFSVSCYLNKAEAMH